MLRLMTLHSSAKSVFDSFALRLVVLFVVLHHVNEWMAPCQHLHSSNVREVPSPPARGWVRPLPQLVIWFVINQIGHPVAQQWHEDPLLCQSHVLVRCVPMPGSLVWFVRTRVSCTRQCLRTTKRVLFAPSKPLGHKKVAAMASRIPLKGCRAGGSHLRPEWHSGGAAVQSQNCYGNKSQEHVAVEADVAMMRVGKESTRGWTMDGVGSGMMQMGMAVGECEQ